MTSHYCPEASGSSTTRLKSPRRTPNSRTMSVDIIATSITNRPFYSAAHIQLLRHPLTSIFERCADCRREGYFDSAVAACTETVASSKTSSVDVIDALIERARFHSSLDCLNESLADITVAQRLSESDYSADAWGRIAIRLWKSLILFSRGEEKEAVEETSLAAGLVTEICEQNTADQSGARINSEGLASACDEEVLLIIARQLSGPDWRFAVSGIDYLVDRSTSSHETRVLAWLLRSIWNWKNSNDSVGLLASLREVRNEEVALVTRRSAEVFDVRERLWHKSDGFSEKVESRLRLEQGNANELSIKEIMESVAGRIGEAAEHRDQVQEILKRIEEYRHAERLGVRADRMSPEVINHWISEHQKERWSKEEMKEFLEAIRYFANELDQKLVYCDDSGRRIPCRLVVQKMSATSENHAFRVFEAGSRGKAITYSKSLPRLSLEPR